MRSLDHAFETLGEGLRAAAPKTAPERPTVVLLSDGKLNSAFYEHAMIAAHLGVPLVAAEQLSVRRGRLFVQWHAETLIEEAEQLALFELLVRASGQHGEQVEKAQSREQAQTSEQEDSGAHAV